MKKVFAPISICIIISMVLSLFAFSDSAYNPTNAVYYATLFANSTSVPYFDYFPNADCTNFVSSCLWNGDFRTMDSVPSSQSYGVKNESTKWYSWRYTGQTTLFGVVISNWTKWKTSTTWVRVYNTGSGKGLFQYMVDAEHCTYIQTSILNDVIQYSDVGDVIQCGKQGKEPEHSIIVTSKSSTDIGVSAHTNARNDESFSAIFFNQYDYFYIIKPN